MRSLYNEKRVEAAARFIADELKRQFDQENINRHFHRRLSKCQAYKDGSRSARLDSPYCVLWPWFRSRSHMTWPRRRSNQAIRTTMNLWGILHYTTRLRMYRSTPAFGALVFPKTK